MQRNSKPNMGKVLAEIQNAYTSALTLLDYLDDADTERRFDEIGVEAFFDLVKSLDKVKYAVKRLYNEDKPL